MLYRMFLEVIIRYEREFNTSVTDLKVKCKVRQKRLKNLINGWIFRILRKSIRSDDATNANQK